MTDKLKQAMDRRGLPEELTIETSGPNVFESVKELENALEGWERAGWSLGHVAQDLMLYHLTDKLPALRSIEPKQTGYSEGQVRAAWAAARDAQIGFIRDLGNPFKEMSKGVE